MSYPQGYPFPQNPYPGVPPLPEENTSNNPMGFSQSQYPPYPQQNPPYPQQNPPYPTAYSGPVYPSGNPPYPGGHTQYEVNNSYVPPPHPNFQQMHSNFAPPQQYTQNPVPPYPNQQPCYPTQAGMYQNQAVPNPNYPTQYATNYQPHPQAEGAFVDDAATNDIIQSIETINLNSSSTEYVKENPVPKPRPTIVPADPFSPRNDAEALRKAMKGLGTDEKAIINILARRTNAQRLEISAQYKTLFGKDLVKQLVSELGGNFETIVVAAMTPISTLYARDLHDAISGLGTNEDTIIEVLCGLDNQQIAAVNREYQQMYKNKLENDLKGDTSGSFQRLLVSLCQGMRDENEIVDHAEAKADANNLYTAGEKKLGTDETTFNMILASRSIPQLRQIFAEYEAISRKSLEQAIKNEFSGSSEAALLAIVKSVRHRAEYFAERLHNSLAGLGTKDRALIRLVVTRSEVDMEDIKQAFQTKYNKTLASQISGDTSGHYQKMLLAMIT